MEGGGSQGRRVVVVGGGVAGALLATYMQFDADVVLVDPKEYFEIPWAGQRSRVEPPFAERALIKHTDYFTNGRVITSPAIGVTDTEVLTEDSQTVTYDYLVIATGHIDSVPRSKSNRLKEFEQDHEKLKISNSVLIIGGGRMGVELAGEIAVDYPDKKVTVVHNGSRLLEILGPKASDKALKWLRSKGVEVLLEQSIDLNSISEVNGEYTTSAGKSITADCHFVCVGRPLGSTWLQETVLKENLDRFGRLVVDENLRVKGRKNIFAIGDITDLREIKQGYLAHKHAAVVAKNLKRLMNGAMESKLATYKPSSAMAVVSLGRKSAVAQFPYATMIGIFPGMFKSKDLFVGWTRKQMGLNR